MMWRLLVPKWKIPNTFNIHIFLGMRLYGSVMYIIIKLFLKYKNITHSAHFTKPVSIPSLFYYPHFFQQAQIGYLQLVLCSSKALLFRLLYYTASNTSLCTLY